MRTARPHVRFLVDRAGGSVAYAVHGHGPTLVLPAWWVGHLEKDWDLPAMRAFLEALGQVATVVRYDRPGVGLSDPARGPRSLDEESDLLGRVVEATGARRVSVLAFSCGGPPAVAFAAAHPALVERLIFYGSYADGQALAPPDLQDALCGLVRAHWGAGVRTLADVFVADAGPEQREDFTVMQRAATDAETAEAVLRLTYAMDVRSLLPEVRAPTWVVHRRRDRAVPYEAGRALATGIAGATLITLEGRIHPPWMGEDSVAALVDIVRGGAPQALAAYPCRLDAGNRELQRDGEAVPLTPLEFGLLADLLAHEGRAVAREELIERVWEQATAGSNVVDAVVRSVRRKLGPYAPSIETVKGLGYRFRGWVRKAGR
ncbi:MAG: alpha/beta fold hydrolase [Sandaracinaceae bacterium]